MSCISRVLITPTRLAFPCLSIIEQEAKSGLPGSNTLVRKLTEIIFVQALRIHMYKSNKNAGFFKLIENPQLSKTLKLFIIVSIKMGS
jgi:hypothetical protein